MRATVGDLVNMVKEDLSKQIVLDGSRLALRLANSNQPFAMPLYIYSEQVLLEAETWRAFIPHEFNPWRPLRDTNPVR